MPTKKLQIHKPTKELKGEITPPGSKSYSHRAFILAGLSEGVSIIKNPLSTGDVKVTIDLLRSLGVKIIPRDDNTYIVRGNTEWSRKWKGPFNCRNSGTTFRIFAALALIIKNGLNLSGEFIKRNRPILPLLKALESLGAEYEISNDAIFIYRKNTICNAIRIPGNISSQFITALLILSPLLDCDSNKSIEINLTTPVVSYPYLKISLFLLSHFGINIQEKKQKNGLLTYQIENSQKYRAQEIEIPSDFSGAAFIIAAGTLTPKNSTIKLKNLNFNDPQGDKRLIAILQQMGARIQVIEDKNEIIIHGNLQKYPLDGIEIDCSDIPDLFPILCVIGVYAKGKTVLKNIKTIRLKESDRVSIMTRELTKMGVKINEKPNKIVINHSQIIKGTQFEHENDHRIAMACTIAALFSDTKSIIPNIKIVEDSYPNFVGDLISLGANLKLKDD